MSSFSEENFSALSTFRAKTAPNAASNYIKTLHFTLVMLAFPNIADKSDIGPIARPN